MKNEIIKENKNMKNEIILISMLLALSISCCNTTEPPPPVKTITLTLEDAASVEAWIKLTTTNLQLPATVTLQQNDLTRRTINLVKPDTLLYIDSLLPNTTYTYHAAMQPSNQAEVKSNVLSVATLDTTSHNFTWQTFTFGEHSSSVLRDIAIIDENNIWAVGEIYLNDSLGNPDPHTYNAVHWDGNTWLPQKITVEFRGNLITPPLEGIYAFSSDDIWMVGSLPIHGDGEVWQMFDLRTTVDPNLSLSKVWGSNSNDMYFVGRAGSIAHYSGPTGGWQKIESGTDLSIQDIWGVPDDNNGFYKYLAADNAMLKINQQNELTRISVDQDMILISIWAKTDKLIYTAGNGVFLFKNNYWEKIDELEVNTTYRIKGEELNEIYGIVLPGSTINYFNGYSWYQIYTEQNNRFWRIDSKGQIVVATGYAGYSAIITIIRKN